MTPGCGPAGRRAFAHADTRRGTHRHDARLQTSRPSAFAHADMRRAPCQAADRAHPRPRPPLRAEGNLARSRAAYLAALCPLAHADSHRIKKRPAPPRLLPTPTRAEEHLAGLQFSRPRRQSARKMSRKLPLGRPHQQRVSNVQDSKSAWRDDEGVVRVGLTECAGNQPCASRLPI